MDPHGPITTLVDMLAARARGAPDAPAFTFRGRATTYGDVWDDAGRVASLLHRAGLPPGGTVVLALPNGAAFFSAFYGAQRAGGTAVPVFPGLGPRRLAAAAQACGAGVVVHAAGGDRAGDIEAAASSRGIRAVRPADWHESDPSAPPVEVGADDIAFVQYTSGTTGEPKGVLITQANLLTNIRQLIAGMAISRRDRFVSWLPVYHDMGLILMTMVPFSLGAELHLLPTSLGDVSAWLETIERTGATVTAAPDFAYRLCLRQVPGPGRFDLSSLRMALNAAEPVRAGTIAEFETRFGLDGVMVAGYGLAEATVGVSTWPPGSTPRVDGRGFVSVGPPFPGVEIRIAADGEDAPPGSTGEILVASTANAAGYLGDPEETERVFGVDGYVRTGDLGHLDRDGNLYVVGRKKNIIIQGGRNLAPQEMVEIVDDRPGVRLSAVVGIDRGGIEGEQAHVFAEVREDVVPPEGHHALAVEISADIHRELGIRPGRVHLLERGSIPLTHTGKIRHAALRDSFLNGDLHARGAVLYPRR